MNLVWADSATADLQELHDFIAPTAPATATKLINALIKRVGSISRFPSLGRVVPEFGRPDLREVSHKNFRIIYQVDAERVLILSIVRGSRDLGLDRSIRRAIGENPDEGR